MSVDIHKRCVRLAEQAVGTCHQTDAAGHSVACRECITAAFEPTIERLIKSLTWAMSHLPEPEVAEDTEEYVEGYENAAQLLAELERKG